MYVTRLTPRFNDTDALGHINNASYATWFEEARRPIFEIFTPDLDPKKWCLILARLELDYVAQGHYQKSVEIRSWVEKIGNSSFVLSQEAYQAETLISRCKAYHVSFDYSAQKSRTIEGPRRERLEAFTLKS